MYTVFVFKQAFLTGYVLKPYKYISKCDDVSKWERPRLAYHETRWRQSQRGCLDGVLVLGPDRLCS